MAYYPSILGQCPDCCACPQPELLYKVRSASKSKCGTTDPASPTTPPTVFKKVTGCGYVTTYDPNTPNPSHPGSTYCGSTLVRSCDIRCLAGLGGFDPNGINTGFSLYGDNKVYASMQMVTDCSYTIKPGWGTGSAHYRYVITRTLVPTEADPNAPGFDGRCFTVKATYEGGWTYDKEPEDPDNPDGAIQAHGSATVNPDTGKFNGSITYPDGTSYDIVEQDNTAFYSLVNGSYWYNAFTETCSSNGDYVPVGDPLIPPDDEYSDEATTSALEGDTAAALPDWPDDWTSGFYNGATLAYRNLATDERTLSTTDGQYCFRFKAPKVGAGKCYKIGPWVERFIPRLTDGSEGDPVDTVRGVLSWDGSLPDDYDPDDYTTWPLSDVFDVDVPGANGRVILGYYTDEEDPGTFIARVPTAVCTGCS